MPPDTKSLWQSEDVWRKANIHLDVQVYRGLQLITSAILVLKPKTRSSLLWVVEAFIRIASVVSSILYLHLDE